MKIQVIELADAGFRYGGRTVFEGVSAELSPGSFHFLTGPSGSGKTTFLRLCTSMLLPTSGYVQLFGRDTRGLTHDEIAAMRRRMGIVRQEADFLPHLTLAENIQLPVRLSKRSVKASTNDLDELLGWVGLTEVAHAYPYEVSGGEQSRAALARAVISDPDMIVADEPTGNVDAEMAKKLVYLLVQLNKMGKTCIVATHDMNMVRMVKPLVQTRVLRLKNQKLDIAGADL